MNNESDLLTQCNSLSATITHQKSQLDIRENDILHLKSQNKYNEKVIRERDELIISITEENKIYKQMVTDLKNKLHVLKNENQDTEEFLWCKEVLKDKEELVTEFVIENSNLEMKLYEVCMERNFVKQDLNNLRMKVLDNQNNLKEYFYNEKLHATSDVNLIHDSGINNYINQHGNKYYNSFELCNKSSQDTTEEGNKSNNIIIKEQNISCKYFTPCSILLSTSLEERKENLIDRNIHDISGQMEKKVIEPLKTILDVPQSIKQHKKIISFKTTPNALSPIVENCILDHHMHSKFNNETKVVYVERHVMELKSMVESRDNTIALLDERLVKHTDDMARMLAEVDRLYALYSTMENIDYQNGVTAHSYLDSDLKDTSNITFGSFADSQKRCKFLDKEIQIILKNNESELKHWKETTTDAVKESEILRLSLDEAETQIASIKSEMEQIKYTTSNNIKQIEKEMNNKDIEVERLNEEVNKSNVIIENLRTDIMNKNIELNDVHVSLKQHVMDLEKLRYDITCKTKEIKKYQSTLEEKNEDMEILQKSVGKAEENVRKKKRQIQESVQEINNRETLLSNLRNSIDVLEVRLKEKENTYEKEIVRMGCVTNDLYKSLLDAESCLVDKQLELENSKKGMNEHIRSNAEMSSSMNELKSSHILAVRSLERNIVDERQKLFKEKVFSQILARKNDTLTQNVRKLNIEKNISRKNCIDEIVRRYQNVNALLISADNTKSMSLNFKKQEEDVIEMKTIPIQDLQDEIMSVQKIMKERGQELELKNIAVLESVNVTKYNLEETDKSLRLFESDINDVIIERVEKQSKNLQVMSDTLELMRKNVTNKLVAKDSDIEKNLTEKQNIIFNMNRRSFEEKEKIKHLRVKLSSSNDYIAHLKSLVKENVNEFSTTASICLEKDTKSNLSQSSYDEPITSYYKHILTEFGYNTQENELKSSKYDYQSPNKLTNKLCEMNIEREIMEKDEELSSLKKKHELLLSNASTTISEWDNLHVTTQRIIYYLSTLSRNCQEAFSSNFHDFKQPVDSLSLQDEKEVSQCIFSFGDEQTKLNTKTEIQNKPYEGVIDDFNTVSNDGWNEKMKPLNNLQQVILSSDERSCDIVVEHNASLENQPNFSLFWMEKKAKLISDYDKEINEKNSTIEKLCLEITNFEVRISTLQSDIETAHNEIDILKKGYNNDNDNFNVALEISKEKQHSIIQTASSDECDNSSRVTNGSEPLTKTVGKHDYLNTDMTFKMKIAESLKWENICVNRSETKLANQNTTSFITINDSLIQDNHIISLNNEIESLEILLKKEGKRPNQSKDDSRAVFSYEPIKYIKKIICSLDAIKINLDVLKDNREKMSFEYTKCQEMITERDCAISAMVRSSVTQEQQIKSLSEEIEEWKAKCLKVKGTNTLISGVSWEEFNRLQQESEIFAGQIIEQDEELEDLRNNLDEKNYACSCLEKEITTLKSEISRIENDSQLSDLKDKLYEAQEINKQLYSERRDLRKMLRTAQHEIERIPEVEAELIETHHILENVKKLNAEKETQVSGVLEHQLKAKLDAAILQKKTLERELKTKETSEYKLKEVEAKLRLDLKDVIAKKSEIEGKLSKQVGSLQELPDCTIEKNTSTEKSYRKEILTLKKQCESIVHLEASLLGRDKKIEDMQKDSQEQDEIISALTAEVKKLRRALQNKPENDQKYIEATIRREFEDDLLPIKNNMKDDTVNAKKMKFKYSDSEESRDEFEKTIISTYERKLSLMQLNKDLTIDGLRKELAQCKEKQKIIDAEMFSKVRELENERMEIKVELEAKVQQKQEKIQFLEQTLAAHEQVSGHMQDELDQLQSGMESVSVTRRAEIEELQEELMDVQSKATKYEREINALKMRIEELKLSHKAEVTKLNDTINSLESYTVFPMARDIQSQRDDKRLSDLSEKLESMKWRLTSLQDENSALHLKLQKTGDPKMSKNDKWRNSALQEQVLMLTQRLKELGDDGNDSIKSSSSRRSTKTNRVTPRELSRRSIPRSPGNYNRVSSSKDEIIMIT